MIIVVDRGHDELLEAFRAAFAPAQGVTVLSDRRRAERRRGSYAVPAERRTGSDRRRPPPRSWALWNFLVQGAPGQGESPTFPQNPPDPEGALLCPACGRRLSVAEAVRRHEDWVMHVRCAW